jgi:hypothetical protein
LLAMNMRIIGSCLPFLLLSVIALRSPKHR